MFSFFFSFYLAIEKKTSSFLVDLKLKTGSILNHERFDRIAEGILNDLIRYLCRSAYKNALNLVWKWQNVPFIKPLPLSRLLVFQSIVSAIPQIFLSP